MVSENSIHKQKTSWRRFMLQVYLKPKNMFECLMIFWLQLIVDIFYVHSCLFSSHQNIFLKIMFFQQKFLALHFFFFNNLVTETLYFKTPFWGRKLLLKREYNCYTSILFLDNGIIPFAPKSSAVTREKNWHDNSQRNGRNHAYWMWTTQIIKLNSMTQFSSIHHWSLSTHKWMTYSDFGCVNYYQPKDNKCKNE